MTTNEPWNVDGAVTVEEEHDHNMTDEERQETLRTLFSIDRLIGAIRVKLIEGAPIAAEKTFNDLDCVRDYLSFIWKRVENWTPPQAKDEKEAAVVRCPDPEKSCAEQSSISDRSEGRTTQDEIKAECKALAELICRKNTDYGDSAEKSPVLLPFLPPRTAIFVRMSDKIERMRTLLTSQACAVVHDETFQDTIRDLAGYCVLLLITDKKTLASMSDEKETNLDQTENG